MVRRMGFEEEVTVRDYAFGSRPRCLWVLGLAAMAMTIAGCGPRDSSGPVVLELKGEKLTLGQLRADYDRLHGPGSFDTTGTEAKKAFLETVANKELLVRVMRERLGGPNAQQSLALSEGNDRRLMGALEQRILAPLSRDTSDVPAMVGNLSRKIQLSWVLTRSDSLAKIARDEVVAGRPFEKVVEQYSATDTARMNGGRLDWIAGSGMLGIDFADELYLQGHEPGYLSRVRRTPRGFEFYRIEAFKDWDTKSDELWSAKLVRPTVLGVRASRAIAAWTDSLRRASGLQIEDGGVAVLHAGMRSYWDSLQAVVKETKKPPSSFAVPFSHFDSAQKATPLYRLRDRAYTVGEFLASLKGTGPKSWPNSPDRTQFHDQVESRVLYGVKLDEARKLGLDRTPEFQLAAKRDEEKLLLDSFYKSDLASGITVTDEEMRSFYDQNTENFRRYDRMRLGYIVFPNKEEATRFYKESVKLPDSMEFWSSTMMEYQQKRPDIRVVNDSQMLDLTKPLPEELQGMVEKGHKLNVSDEIEPVALPGGKWVVGRVLFNEHAGILPYEKVMVPITRLLQDKKINEKVEKLLEDAKARFVLKTYPDRLQAKG